jgi:hypothetical protein
VVCGDDGDGDDRELDSLVSFRSTEYSYMNMMILHEHVNIVGHEYL